MCQDRQKLMTYSLTFPPSVSKITGRMKYLGYDTGYSLPPSVLAKGHACLYINGARRPLNNLDIVPPLQWLL